MNRATIVDLLNKHREEFLNRFGARHLALFGSAARMPGLPRCCVPLADADLSGRIGWLFGTEGRGVSDALAARATLRVSIPMRGFAESLNVAAAAAIAFYQSAS